MQSAVTLSDRVPGVLGVWLFVQVCVSEANERLSDHGDSFQLTFLFRSAYYRLWVQFLVYSAHTFDKREQNLQGLMHRPAGSCLHKASNQPGDSPQLQQLEAYGCTWYDPDGLRRMLKGEPGQYLWVHPQFWLQCALASPASDHHMYRP